LRLDNLIKLAVAFAMLAVAAAGSASAQKAATKAPGGFDTKAKHAILMDADADLIFYEKDPDTLMPPASMSKLMTLALVFRELKAGRIKLDLEDVELDPVLADAMRVVTARAQDKRLKVTASIAEGIHFKADKRAVKQVALNLLSNAVKFTPSDGEISVRGRMSRNAVSISIQDTGIGIPREALQKLGRPFEQVESQLTKTHHGSGLGLAIAKSLVELHGGAMRIFSRFGAGTIVVVRFPLDGKPAESSKKLVA
jgi:signal transduction histidine kinase